MVLMIMTHLQPPSFLEPHGEERNKSRRVSLLRKLRPHRTSSEELDRLPSTPTSPPATPPPPPRLPSTSSAQEPLSTAEIVKQFSDLHDAITAHVQNFYSTEAATQGISQAVVEHASTGIPLPWPQILSFLSTPPTRLASLALCITWTILSRTLLLKLGTSNSPGSTFLPPEIVECFQSFSLGKGAVTLGKDEPSPVNFALLSRWKQITAMLCHSTYVADAFSHFDARTVNIERALKDLDPLLATYASPHLSPQTRLADLRNVLRRGALFAFALFAQPSFWKFDWCSDRAVASGKTEAEHDPERVSSIESVGVAAVEPVRLESWEIVRWPCLVRVMDGEGCAIIGEGDGRGEGMVLGRKQYLDGFGGAG